MKIAVTGASGHVGSNLCKKLFKNGFKVRALIHHNTRTIQDLPVELIEGNVLDKDSVTRLLQGVDFLVHLAAAISIKGDPDGMVSRINSEGTRNIVEAAKEANLKRMIHFSSIHAFRQHPVDVPLDESRPLVTVEGLAYDRSKAEGERVVMHAVSEGLDAIVLSPTAIIGPEDPGPSLTGKALLGLFHRQIPMLVPGGYNWVDVRDVVDGTINAFTMGRKGEKYLLSGTWLSLRDISRMVRQITGSNSPQTVIPFWIARIGLPFITVYSKIAGGEPLYTRESLQIISESNQMINSDKAKRELQFSPRNIEDTIRDTFTWFKEKGFIQY